VQKFQLGTGPLNPWFKGDVVPMGTVAKQSSSLPSILESAASKPVPANDLEALKSVGKAQTV